MRLLVTRPEGDGARTAARLRALGHEVLELPLLRIEAMAHAHLGPGPWAAILLTSANAVRAIAAQRRFKEMVGLPAYVVGARTRTAAIAAGFAQVISADGDADDLIALVVAQPPVADLPLLYPAGSDRAGDVDGALRSHGFPVETVEVYRSVMVADLRDDVRTALAACRVERRAALFRTHRGGVRGRVPNREDQRRNACDQTLVPVRPSRRTAARSRSGGDRCGRRTDRGGAVAIDRPPLNGQDTIAWDHASSPSPRVAARSIEIQRPQRNRKFRHQCGGEGCFGRHLRNHGISPAGWPRVDFCGQRPGVDNPVLTHAVLRIKRRLGDDIVTQARVGNLDHQQRVAAATIGGFHSGRVDEDVRHHIGIVRKIELRLGNHENMVRGRTRQAQCQRTTDEFVTASLRRHRHDLSAKQFETLMRIEMARHGEPLDFCDRLAPARQPFCRARSRPRGSRHENLVHFNISTHSGASFNTIIINPMFSAAGVPLPSPSSPCPPCRLHLPRPAL